MYFATIFRDSYLESERRDMAEWLDDLFPVNGGSEFAPQVVYLYWDYSTHEPLYLGLASEARRRFEEHNGLRYSAPGSSKKKEIDDYFTKQSRLGFSVIAASSSAPINTAATRQANKSLRPWNGLTWGLEEAAEDELRMFEGRFINAGKSAGVLPWNNIQGWWRGAVTAQSHSALVLGLFTGQADSLFVGPPLPAAHRTRLRCVGQRQSCTPRTGHAYMQSGGTVLCGTHGCRRRRCHALVVRARCGLGCLWRCASQ